MKVVILIKKEVVDSTEAKRLWILINQKVSDIPELTTNINASVNEEEINGAPD